MNSPPNPAVTEHSQEWDDRLQDWLDGELDAAQTTAFDLHLQSCQQCRGSVAALERLDAALIEASPRLALSAAFDARLLARIEAIDDGQRAEARRRLEQEWQQQMQALSRNWRRTLLFLIAGMIAGVALIFALMTGFERSGLTDTLVNHGAAELGRDSSGFLRIGITTLLGVGLGTLVAPWLAKLSD